MYENFIRGGKMTNIKVAILGFGTVGEGVYRTIQSHAAQLTAVLGEKVEVAAVLIKNTKKQRNISKDILLTTDYEEILSLPELHVVIEAIVGKEPTFTFLKKAIKRGCHIITANKEMFANHGKELLELAQKNKVSVGYEATVAGGIPIIQTLRQLLKINRVQQIEGILNGTSNFILTEMREKKQSFPESLELAQQNGYAEADPTNDVEGFDAFFKTMILSRIAFGEEPDWQEVERAGITNITRELIEAAEKLGLRFKHIASIKRDGRRIIGTVKPVLVGTGHPFYHVEGVENAVSVHTDIIGRITLQGPGAGMFPTASAVIEDLVFVQQNHSDKKIFTSTSASDKEEVTRSAGEYWLVQDHAKKNIETTWHSKVSDGIYIIKAGEKEVKQLGLQCYFSIQGEWIKPVTAKEPVTAI